MLLSILGLLLAGAEPSSYGFLTHGTRPPHGDSSRQSTLEATPQPRVVHHANDLNNKTMHIHEVPPACMEHPAARKHNMPELTPPPHTAQRDQVHPRGPANLRDVNQNTTGSDYAANRERGVLGAVLLCCIEADVGQDQHGFCLLELGRWWEVRCRVTRVTGGWRRGHLVLGPAVLPPTLSQRVARGS